MRGLCGFQVSNDDLCKVDCVDKHCLLTQAQIAANKFAKIEVVAYKINEKSALQLYYLVWGFI